MKEVNIRQATTADMGKIIEIFKSSISELGSKHYAPKQIKAWKKRSEDLLFWKGMLKEELFVVGELNQKVGGFGSVNKGKIGMMYVAPEFSREGIAKKILTHLIEVAKSQGHLKLTSEVSETAKPFFEYMGFISLGKQTFVREGVEIYNYKMERNA